MEGLIAQQGMFYQFKFKNETKLKGHKIYYENLTNNGDNMQINVNKILQKQLSFLFNTYAGISKKKIQNYISWTRDYPLFEKVNTATEADVVVGGHYIIKTYVDIEEKLAYERQTNIGGAIPYYEIRQTNTAEIHLVISYTYKDQSIYYDTIDIVKAYERKPKTKYVSLEQLLEKCQNTLSVKSSELFRFYTIDHIWYKFPKVKSKDKALKQELKDAGDLLASGEIYKLGNLYKRIYEADNSNKTAAFCLAICYELIGNYPKAEEYYAIMPNFHAKIRMKENRVLYNYLISIREKLPLKDF